MFFETVKAIDRLVDYNKLPDGSWRADVKGVVDVHVQGRTLSECQRQMYQAVDEIILRWVTGVAEVSRTGDGAACRN